MNKLLIIDRLEGDFDVVESGAGLINIPKADLPAKSREGDVLIIQVDDQATGKRKQKIEGLMNSLFKD
jgi:hypothetical protein